MSEKITLELYNEKTEELSEVVFDCDIFVEPTEYEGGYVFFQGGISLEDWKVNPFIFGGVSYPESKDFPEELIKYVVGIENNDIRALLENEIDNLDVPKKHYGLVR